MKTKYPSMFGILAIFLLVASFVVPVNMANPAPVEAYDPICQWDYVGTPGMLAGFTRDVLSPSEVNKLVIGSDTLTMWAVDTANSFMSTTTALSLGGLYKSSSMGLTWSGSPFDYLCRDLNAAGTLVNYNPVWDVAIAPDDPNFVAVVLDDAADATVLGPRAVWVSTDGGTNWQDTNLAAATFGTASEIISCIDISPSYGATRDILVGTRTIDGDADGDIYVLKAPGFTAWTDQDFPTVAGADVYAAKFSPTYVGDAAIVAIASPSATATNTWQYVGIRDLAVGTPTTDWATYYTPTEITTAGTTTSSGNDNIVTADLELPSDFSGATSSLRRTYVSIDADTTDEAGLYRLDDTVVYQLMDTGTTFTAKRISSIAYYGTYASGKLLAGEVLGYACTATVPTWFTDSPTTCPIPCWYPALKPTTGATGPAANVTCAVGERGFGNAQVAWRVDGELAYVGTSSASPSAGGVIAPAADATSWPGAWKTGLALDESAFGLSRNNGETWNQLALIDTEITRFTDVAPAADCSTVYLASVNTNGGADNCTGFDSVWRSGTAAAVVAPLPPMALGTYWERVLCHVTAKVCADTQSEHAILRLAPDKTDGQIVFWAAGGGDTTDTDAVLWTPDYGDYWAAINPRITVQDLAAASSTLIYILNGLGVVQKMPYTGTAWSSAVLSVDTGCNTAHTIAAFGEDYVLVGNVAYSTAAPVALSKNGGASFSAVLGTTGDSGAVHVAFDPAFADNAIIYAGFEAAGCSIWRYQVGTSANWVDLLGNGAVGSVHTPGYFGLALAHTGGALYGAHGVATGPVVTTGVERTLTPTSGMPKPGMCWDCLNIFRGGLAPAGVVFTEQPSSLKMCGCLTIDTDSTLYAIDNNVYYVPLGAGTLVSGGLWTFTDCVAKVGPTLTMEDGLLVGCDPVSGRNQEINFTWEQLCLATGYDIEIAKDTGFTQRVFDWVGSGYTLGTGAVDVTLANIATILGTFYAPAVITSPALIFPVGAGSATWANMTTVPLLVSQLECGHKYYWKVYARACVTGQIARSPASEVRSFTIKAGLPVSADYYGLKLLSPDNGCIACSVSPASFSWSPFKGTTKYKFVLAKDAALTDVLAEAETATTAYEYDGTLDYSTNYFWRVMCVEPAPSDWSATFSFQTEAAPAAPEGPPAAPATPMWVWIIIALGAILVIVTLVLIFKTRRV